MRFRDQNIVFANGDTGPSKGQNSAIPTANPLNYFHVISNSAELPKLAIDGKLSRVSGQYIEVFSDVSLPALFRAQGLDVEAVEPRFLPYTMQQARVRPDMVAARHRD